MRTLPSGSSKVSETVVTRLRLLPKGLLPFVEPESQEEKAVSASKDTVTSTPAFLMLGGDDLWESTD